MIRNTYITATLLIAILLPTTSFAYTTSNQTATTLNETTALFTVTYSFGHGKHDFYLPVLAVRDQAFGTESNTVGYEILEESDDYTDIGTTTGLVISSAELIEDGFYKVPAGTSARFTLVTLFSSPDDALEMDYALRVTDLPFYRDDERVYQRLNPSELQYYLTPEAELNDSNDV